MPNDEKTQSGQVDGKGTTLRPPDGAHQAGLIAGGGTTPRPPHPHLAALRIGDTGGGGTTLTLDPPRMVSSVHAVKADDDTIHLTFHES